MRPRVSLFVLVALAAVALSASAQVAGDPGTAKDTKPSLAGQPAAAKDPMVVGPNIYRLVLENDRVRVMEARFQPGEKIGLHSHPDHVVVVTSAGKLALTNSKGNTQELDAKVGDTFFLPAEAHSAENVGTTEFVCIVTELKGKPKAKDQASPKPGTTEVQQGKVDG